MESTLLKLVLVGALMGLRKQEQDNPRRDLTRPWECFWDLWHDIGAPALPCTAPWLGR